MAAPGEVLRVIARLDEAIAANTHQLILDNLNALSVFDITTQTLKETKLGVKVANLKAYPDAPEVAKVAAALVTKWRSKVLEESKSPTVTPAMQKLAEDRKKVDALAASPTAKAPVPTAAQRLAALFLKVVQEKVGFLTEAEAERLMELGVRIRERAPDAPPTADDAEVAMLAQKRTAVEVEKQAAAVAAELEAALKAATADALKPAASYADKYRAIMFNLPHNADLALNVFNREVPAAALVAMRVEDMVSDEAKKANAEIQRRAAEASMGDWASRNRGKQLAAVGLADAAGQLTCKNCKSTNTEFSERQTRSADEPTTKFAYCHNCGNRWKFS